MADRHHHYRGGGEVRDHRWGAPQGNTTVRVDWRNNGGYHRDRGDRVRYRYRDYDRSNYRVVRAERSRPVYRDGRFHFSGGFYRPYTRPVFNVRYTNYYARPQAVYESYQTVPGYIWIAGQWTWNGYEWQWNAGHYEVDTSYQDNYYDGNVYYDYGY